jgi:hypothetical protein
MQLYHFTPTSNLPKIQKEGLIPSIGERSKNCEESVPTLFFFDSLDAAIDGFTNWLENEFEEETELTLLTIEISPSTVFKKIAFEIQIFEPIPPSQIIETQPI